MKQIPLHRGGQVVAHALVDDEDYPRVSQYHWYASTNQQGQVYGYRIVNRTGKNFLGRFLLNAQPGQLVLYLNENTLDNRKGNLKLGTASDRAHSKTFTGVTSQYRGVSWSKRGKWQAIINKGSRRKWLGYFDSEEEAARAYDEAAREWYGDHARLNFPGK